MLFPLNPPKPFCSRPLSHSPKSIWKYLIYTFTSNNLHIETYQAVSEKTDIGRIVII